MAIDEDSEILLGAYADQDGSHRYFKNRLGAFGQYYFGPLRDLRIVDRPSGGTAQLVGYDKVRGVALAEAFESKVPSDAFFQAVESRVVTWKQLDALSSFCPCALSSNPVEHELLLDLFLARSPLFEDDDGALRRESLGLILDLASRSAQDTKLSLEDQLRNAAYSGILEDGSSWQVAPRFENARKGWATYQRNELLSIAVQGLFAAVLRGIERDQGGRLQRVEDAGDVLLGLLSARRKSFNKPLVALISETQSALPPLSDWSNSTHELQRAYRAQQLRLKDDQLEDLAEHSLAILLALLARGGEGSPYSSFRNQLEDSDITQINLRTFQRMAETNWATMNVGEWIRWLAVTWGVAHHLRIALGKLRSERRDTFRIRPLEGELRVIEAPEPTYTVPRIRTTVQILRDLGLLDIVESAVALTARGLDELEAARDH